jgi:iron complex outermembrane receptor protein
MIYGTLTSGYKAGSFNTTSVTAPGPVDPEKVYGIELGMKQDVSLWARIEVAAFGYRYKDLQISYLPTNTDPTILTNADEAEIFGLELSGVFEPLDNLVITPGISWLARAKYTSYQNGTAYIDNATAQPAFPFGYTVQTEDFSGNRMQRTPKLSGNIAMRYTWRLATGSLKATGNIYYTDSYYFSAQSADFARQDSYTLVNAALSYTTADERWSVTAAGQNLSDEETYSSILPNVIGINGQYSPPRTYSLTVAFKY